MRDDFKGEAAALVPLEDFANAEVCPFLRDMAAAAAVPPLAGNCVSSGDRRRSALAATTNLIGNIVFPGQQQGRTVANSPDNFLQLLLRATLYRCSYYRTDPLLLTDANECRCNHTMIIATVCRALCCGLCGSCSRVV
jgi:hypothetical protein